MVFYDNNSNSYKPLAWAAVSGSVTDGINTWPVSTITNASGTFTTQCNTDLATFNTLAVDVEDDYIKVTPNTEVVSVVRRLSACGGSQLIALSDPSKVFSVMEITAVAAETKFSRVRPQLKVQIAACGSTSCYDAVGDSILLNSTHVWGYVGVMTQAHEYGHAYHNKALGPLPSDTGNPTDCSGHGGPVYTNLACAYKEGFAEYFAVLAWPDTANLHGYSPEANPNLLLNSNPFPADSNNPDGSIIEGAVQAFLYDITDPANETGDAIAYSTGYLGDIMATCQVSDGGGDPTHPSGIDHVIRCLEQQVDSSVNGYFYYRNPASTSETESATEPPGWSRSNIRTLWLKDLYNR